jgi:hypothetical protein
LIGRLLCWLGFHHYVTHAVAKVFTPTRIYRAYESRCTRCGHVNPFER